MLYFCFNTDKVTVPITKDLGEIEECIFEKLKNEANLKIDGYGDVLYQSIGVPIGAFRIDDENIDDTEKIIKFVIDKCSEYPIQELDDKSLKDLGIEIKFCKKINNTELDSILTEHIKSNKYAYVKEKVMWKHMTNDEKTDVYYRYLNNIGSNNNELIIIDPYLFATDEMDYCKLLSDIIQKSNPKEVIVITDKTHCKDSSLQSVESNIKMHIDLKYSSDFHDRFWIVKRTKGICTGTSLNGIGKRISIINEIPDEDIKDLVKELYDQNLI